MNIPYVPDYVEKQRRLRKYMQENDYEYALISRRDNFAWFTCGGYNTVLRNSEYGFGTLLVSMDHVCLFSYYMDADRIFCDELTGLDIEKIILKWYQDSKEENAMKLTGGKRTISDIPVPGADYLPQVFQSLEFPMTEHEAELYRELGTLCDRLLTNIADQISPGMSEQEIESMILYEYGMQAMTPKVLLVGSDERITNYRHPCASNKKLDKLALIHPAAEKGNLHANITRMIYFGDKLPDEIEQKYDLLNQLQAQFFAMAKPGVHFMDIYDRRKQLLAAAGYPEEWENHFPGDIMGYMIGCGYDFVKDAVLTDRMPLDIFITLRGAKVEELAMTGPNGAECLSASGYWPVKNYSYGGKDYKLPVIMMK